MREEKGLLLSIFFLLMALGFSNSSSLRNKIMDSERSLENDIENDNVPKLLIPGRRCPEGWVFYEEICYLFHYEASSNLTWNEGKAECEAKGGFLAEIITEGQQQYLISVASLEEDILGTQSWFIGLSNLGSDGRWVWQNSTSDTNFTYWAEKQPDETNGNNHCTVMDAESGYAWVTVSCDASDVGLPLCMRTDINKVELRDGDGESNGNVYAMTRDGVFGPVCDDWYNQNNDAAAKVVCRQLGFSSGTAYGNGYFGASSSAEVMRFIVHDYCTGDEQFLQQCPYTTDVPCSGEARLNTLGVQCHD